MLELLAPVLALELLLKAVALYDLARREPVEVRGGRRWIWVLVIVAVAALGPIAYFIFGRQEGAA